MHMHPCALVYTHMHMHMPTLLQHPHAHAHAHRLTSHVDGPRKGLGRLNGDGAHTTEGVNHQVPWLYCSTPCQAVRRSRAHGSTARSDPVPVLLLWLVCALFSTGSALHLLFLLQLLLLLLMALLM